MGKVPFEAACKLAFSHMTAEKLRETGMEICVEECKTALANIGWTIEGLAEESKRQMHEMVEGEYDKCVRCESTDVDCHPTLPNFMQTYECKPCGEVMKRSMDGKLVHYDGKG